MTIENTDYYVVERNDTLNIIEAQNAMTKILDDDLLIIGRGSTPYKITGAEFKESSGPGPLVPSADDVSASPAFEGGTGTEADPFIITPVTAAPAGVSVLSAQTITIAGIVGQVGSWTSTDVRFNQPDSVIGSDNTWSGKLIYNDTPDTIVDSVYTGYPKIGTVCFKWVVTQNITEESPTTVVNVNLIESDPEGDRFTSQSFVASSQVVDGEPVSTKTIDAHVDGTLSRLVKFDEPLESSEIAPGPNTWADYLGINPLWLADGSSEEYAFDGNPLTSAKIDGSKGGAGAQIFFNQSNELVLKGQTIRVESTSYSAVTPKYKITFWNSDVVTVQEAGIANFIETPIYGDGVKQITLQSINSNYNVDLLKIVIDGTELTGNVPVTSLTFATGTDMEALAAGDTVNQTNNFTEPLESSTSTQEPNYTDDLNNTLTYAYSAEGWMFAINQAGWDLGFDGDPNTGLQFFTGQYPNTTSWESYDYTFPNGPFTGSPKVEVKWNINSGNNEVVTLRINGSNQTTGDLSTWWNDNNPPDDGWLDISGNITAAGGSFTSLGAYVETTNQPARNTYWKAIRINGVILENDKINVDLTFATGTDMAALEAGDAVSQGGGADYKALTNYNDGAITLTDPEINKFFDGDENTYMVSLAGAWTAGGGNINIDLTSAPITDIKEVKFSFNKALLDSGNMAPTLIYNSTSQGSIINMPRVDTGTHYITTFTPGNAPLTQLGFYLLLNVTVNTDWEISSGIQIIKNDGSVEWLTSGGPTGTVGSITGTTATLSSSSGSWVNGEDVNTGDKVTTGTVASVANTTATLSSSSGAWVNGLNVTGPQKTIVDENTRLYCAFDSNGNVTDLQSDPQDPPYTTQDSNPGLTFTFPATFPSGQTPDEELPDGTTFTVEVTAENSTSSSGPISATVQPEPAAPVVPLAGLTTLYPGTGANQPVVNGIDNLSKSLLWFKTRNASGSHWLYDPLRGTDSVLFSNTANDAQPSPTLASFNNNGFTLANNDSKNTIGYNYVAWNFGKAAGYFDVVKQTLTTSPAVINHTLGTAPGLIIGKNIDTNSDWICSFNGFTDNEYLILNSTVGKQTLGLPLYYAKTDTSFTYNPGGITGAGEYVFYVFAADTPGVIKCGFTSSVNQQVDLGFEPQWMLAKTTINPASWLVVDNKRPQMLYPDTDAVESNDNKLEFNATGFINRWGADIIYVAIAEPPATKTQTPAELAETKLKFATFENRSMVKCGNDAEAKRDNLIIELEAQGYSLSDILNYL